MPIQIIEDTLAAGTVSKYRMFKCIAGLALVGFGLLGAAGKTKSVKPAAIDEEIVITSPISDKDYRLGIYRIEGKVAGGAKIVATLDGKPVEGDDPDKKGVIMADSGGMYSLDLDVAKPGSHLFEIKYKGEKGQKTARKKFIAVNGQNKIEATDTPAEGVVTEQEKPEKPSKPPVKDIPFTSNEEPDDFITIPSDEPSKPEKPAKDKPAKPAGNKKSINFPFVISSHTNKNMLNPGMVNVGGKGKPGQQVKVYVDNHLSMVGTIKPNGRWTFPVKLGMPGKRQIAAINTQTKQRLGLILIIKKPAK